MNVIQEAALMVGIDVPLFPTIFHLICAGCSVVIVANGEPIDEGWLCKFCAAQEKQGE